MASCQMFVRRLDGHTLCLRFSSPLLPLHNLKHRLATLLQVPAQFQRIVSGTRDLTSLDLIVAEPDGSFPSCSLLLRLPGGKGGFGSLLRGAATKAGQKKTSNFDACRDMSGRRLRHVNAEKKLKEWKAEAKERELEKTAEVFLKKHAKQKKEDSGIAKELDRYRQETSKAMEEVESAVGKGLLAAAKLDVDGKRKKVEAVIEASKKARLWTSFNESEEEDSDGELPGEEHGECSRQPCIKPTASGNQSSSSEIDMDNDDNGTRVLLVEKGGHANVQPCSKPTTSGNLSSSSEIAMDNDDNGTRVLFVEKGGHVNVQPCSKPTTSGNQSSSSEIDMDNNDNDTRVLFVEKSEHEIVSSFGLSCSGDKASGAEGFGSKLASDSEGGCVTKAIDLCCVISKSTMSEQLDQASNKGQQCGAMDIMSSGNVNTPSEEPLNFDKFNKVEELQILGLDRLKFELQSRGLKCGGSLAERAARLFLLKTTPLDKLDKKHFAKTIISLP